MNSQVIREISPEGALSFFGFKLWDSLTNILLSLGLPTFDTVFTNTATSFTYLWIYVSTVLWSICVICSTNSILVV